MKKKLVFKVIEAAIKSECPKCGGVRGGFLTPAKEDIRMVCKECGYSTNYVYRWPDELPEMILRYKSSGQVVGRHNRKTKRKKNPDGVLKGQMSFEGA